MKKALLLFSFCLFFSALFAQGKLEEVVYLKDSTVTRGTIMEFVPGSHIRMRSGRKMFEYKLDQIAKITREPARQNPARKSHYNGILELGLADFPAVGGNLPMFSANIVNAYRFNPYCSLGMGIGADISRHKLYNIPVTIDVRAYFTKTKVVPFFALGFGYNAQISSRYGISDLLIYHGVIVHPSVGAQVRLKGRKALSLALGYKMVGSFVADYFNTVNFTPQHAVTLSAGFHF